MNDDTSAKAPTFRSRAGRRIAVALAWSPVLPAKLMKIVMWSAICLFSIDIALVIGLQFRWIGGQWRIFRQWEDVFMTIVAGIWLTQVAQMRRSSSAGVKAKPNLD